jgi:hypothetical protein
MRQLPEVQSATVFGQSMHLLVSEDITEAQIEERLRSVGISKAEIHEIGPSLEDVFVALTDKHSKAQNQNESARAPALSS